MKQAAKAFTITSPLPPAQHDILKFVTLLAFSIIFLMLLGLD